MEERNSPAELAEALGRSICQSEVSKDPGTISGSQSPMHDASPTFHIPSSGTVGLPNSKRVRAIHIFHSSDSSQLSKKKKKGGLLRAVTVLAASACWPQQDHLSQRSEENIERQSEHPHQNSWLINEVPRYTIFWPIPMFCFGLQKRLPARDTWSRLRR